MASVRASGRSALPMVAAVAIGLIAGPTRSDELDGPPEIDKDPRCLERKAATEAYLKSILDAPVSKGRPCPPDPAEIRQREVACRTGRDGDVVWHLVSDGFEAGSSMLSGGVPYVRDVLGNPLRETKDEGFWDIDVYEIPRTLWFPGVTVETRDYVSDAVDFDLATGTVEPTNAIYTMRVDSGDFTFAHGLTLGSSRDRVEDAVGLPCLTVAHLGRTAVRQLERYSYSDTSQPERARYSVTINFGDDDRIESVEWHYDSVWH